MRHPYDPMTVIRRCGHALVWMTLLLTTAALLFFYQPVQISIYDEGVMLTGALHWLNGEMPGVDYYTTYGPLQFYLLSLLLDVSNGSLLFARFGHALIITTPVILLATLFRPTRSVKNTSFTLVFILSSILASATFSAPYYPSHSLPALLAILIVFKVHWENKAHPLLAALLLATILTLVFSLRPVIGILMAIGLCISIPLECFNERFNWTKFRQRASVVFIAIAISTVLILVIDLSTNHSVFHVLELIRNIQSQAYPVMRALPFPRISDITANPAKLPVFASAYSTVAICVVGGATYLLSLLGKIDLSARQRTALFWLLFSTALLFSLALVRTDGPHLAPAFILSIALFYYLLQQFSTSYIKQSLRKSVSASLLVIAALILGFSFIIFGYKQTSLIPTIATDCSLGAIVSAPDECLQTSDEQTEVLGMLDSILKPGERVFSANARHDLIYINNMAYYALSGHLPITYWAHMDPGVQTTSSVQNLIKEELKNYANINGRSIVVVADLDHKIEPNSSAISSGIHILDQYLSSCHTLYRFERSKILECKILPVAGTL